MPPPIPAISSPWGGGMGCKRAFSSLPEGEEPPSSARRLLFFGRPPPNPTIRHHLVSLTTMSSETASCPRGTRGPADCSSSRSRGFADWDRTAVSVLLCEQSTHQNESAGKTTHRLRRDRVWRFLCGTSFEGLAFGRTQSKGHPGQPNHGSDSGAPIGPASWLL